jgi:hypothetical protein
MDLGGTFGVVCGALLTSNTGFWLAIEVSGPRMDSTGCGHHMGNFYTVQRLHQLGELCLMQSHGCNFSFLESRPHSH